jgi:hypothetical protein
MGLLISSLYHRFLGADSSFYTYTLRLISHRRLVQSRASIKLSETVL